MSLTYVYWTDGVLEIRRDGPAGLPIFFGAPATGENCYGRPGRLDVILRCEPPSPQWEKNWNSVGNGLATRNQNR